MRSATPASDVEPEPASRTFDVYQGLIFAVDTKDRYTKRHSGDVARYSVFLAERMGAQPDFIETVRVAGLLHDVGKIGIPDHILRKPGKLTAEEYEIVQQHVVLGDMIVRDLPDVEADPRRRPPPPRALGRDRLCRPAVRRGDPAHRPDPRRLGRLLGDDHDPAVSQGARRPTRRSAASRTRPGPSSTRSSSSRSSYGIENVAGAPLPGMDAPRLWTPYASVA